MRTACVAAAVAALSAGLAWPAHAAVLTVDLPSGARQFSWAALPDGRYELKFDRQGTVTVAPVLPAGMSLEQGEQGTTRVLVVRLPASASVGWSLIGQRLSLVEAPAAAAFSPSAPASAVAASATLAPVAAAAGGPKKADAVPNSDAKAEKSKKTIFEDRKDKALDNFENYRVDMSVPTSPAFAVLGATPETILQPKSPRDLAVSLVQNLSDKDKLGNGVGLDITPYMLWAGKETSLATYEKSDYLPIIANLQVSFGAIKQDTTAGDKITRAAWGLTAPLYDAADPRKSPYLRECFKTNAAKILGVGGPTVPEFVGDALKKMKAGEEVDLVAPTTQLSAAFDACRESFKKQAWTSTRWIVGLGRSYHNRGGDQHAGAYGLWTTYTLDLSPSPDPTKGEEGPDTRALAMFHLRRLGREEVLSGTDSRGFVLRRGNLFGLGAKYGSDKRNVTLEASWYRARLDTGERENSRKLAIGGEMMINKDLWLVLTVGGEGGLKNGKNSPFMLGGLKFGTASESTGAFGP